MHKIQIDMKNRMKKPPVEILLHVITADRYGEFIDENIRIINKLI